MIPNFPVSFLDSTFKASKKTPIESFNLKHGIPRNFMCYDLFLVSKSNLGLNFGDDSNGKLW